MDDSQAAYLMVEIRDALKEIAGSLEKIASQNEERRRIAQQELNVRTYLR